MRSGLEDGIRRAREFLEGERWDQGFWLDFRASAGYSSHWVTAYVATALADAGAGAEFLAPVTAWLLEDQFTEGGWGFNRAVLPDADSTGNVALLLAHLRAQVGEPIEPILGHCARVLEPFFTDEGGVRTYQPRPADAQGRRPRYVHDGSRWCGSHTCVTALAAEALLELAGRAASPRLTAAATFLRRHQSADGGWESFWWCGRSYVTHRAARFLARLSARDGSGHKEWQAGWQAARSWVERGQAADGSWADDPHGPGNAFDTALSASTLLLDPAHSPAAVDRAIAWLLAAQHDDGGWTAGARLREPTALVEVDAPWERPDAEYNRRPVTDGNRLFTTATVLSALAAYRPVTLPPAPGHRPS
jgi:squalene-hopene/tetraprenyl-beta-curcumene cyclase